MTCVPANTSPASDRPRRFQRLDRLSSGRATLRTAASIDITARGGRLIVGDLILAEVLQGTRDNRHFEQTQAYLSRFDLIAICNRRVAIEAARNYQHLRSRGITVRKTIDTLIATRCILDRLPLLYSDRDFDPFVQHLGLRSALDAPGVHNG